MRDGLSIVMKGQHARMASLCLVLMVVLLLRCPHAAALEILPHVESGRIVEKVEWVAPGRHARIILRNQIYGLASGAGSEVRKFEGYQVRLFKSNANVLSVSSSKDTLWIQTLSTDEEHGLLIQPQKFDLRAIKAQKGIEVGKRTAILPLDGIVTPDGVINVLSDVFVIVPEGEFFYSLPAQSGYFNAVTPFSQNGVVAATMEQADGRSVVRVLDAKNGKPARDYEADESLNDWPAQQLIWLSDDCLLSVLHARREPGFKVLRLQKDGTVSVLKSGSLEGAALISKGDGVIQVLRRAGKNPSTEEVWNGYTKP